MTGPRRNPVAVLKIGGSILTDRRTYCVVDPASLRRVAEALAGWLPEAPRPVVLILGGGSFGHNVVVEHGLAFDGRHRHPAETFELTARLFELKTAMARELAACGVAAMPLQEAVLFGRRPDGGLRVAQRAVLERCFEGDWLPLVTGGLVPDRGRSFVPVSSDRLVLPLAEAFPVRRYVALTDRPGLCDPTAEGWPLVERVRMERCAEILELLRPSQKIDVTRGMEGKLEAILELAAAGVGSVIGDGRGLDAAKLAGYFGDDPPGTSIEAAAVTTGASGPTPRSSAPRPRASTPRSGRRGRARAEPAPDPPGSTSPPETRDGTG